MSSDPTYRLSFRLPPALRLSVLPGRHTPCIHGCVLEIERDLTVAIEGPSREQVFNQARRFMRVTAKGHGALVIPATLFVPVAHLRRGDTWHIAVTASGDVVITAGPIAPDIGIPERCTA